MNEEPQMLVVVHPGSLCGSADFNLGCQQALAARSALVASLNAWQGGVVVIDGELSDELLDYPALDQAISRSLESAKAKGHPSLRVTGEDPDQIERIRKFVEEDPERKDKRFVVTGAWYHPEDGSGCVGSVLGELERLGCWAEVADSVTSLCGEKNGSSDAYR